MIDITIFENKMDLVIDKLSNEFIKIKSGAINPMILNNVNVKYYDASTPIAQIANISSPEPRQLIIKPYDKSIIRDMTAAIKNANLGIDPVNEGELIRITIPTLTEETRKIYVKKAKEVSEEGRISIRNIRRIANDEVKSSKDYTEDDVKSELELIQKLTDSKISKVDELEKNKEKELMEI